MIKKLIFVLVLFGQLALAAPSDEVLLAGTPRALAIATENLIEALGKSSPDFSPEDVKIRFQILETGYQPQPANAVDAFLELPTAREDFDESRVRLEGILGRRISVSSRAVPAAELTRLEEEFNEGADTLWPLYEQLKTSPVPQTEDADFVKPGKLFRESITNRSNLSKAALRFGINSTLIGLSLTLMEGLAPGTSAMLGAVGGGLSFMFMAGNDFFNSWLASPYWTKLPSPKYLRKYHQESGGQPHSFKMYGMGMVKDSLIITGYIGIFTAASFFLGVVPESFASMVRSFVTSLGLSALTESHLSLMNSHLTQQAIGKLPAETPHLEARIAKIRKVSATAALIQSPIVTTLQILASLGSPVGQVALAGLGVIGAVGYYVFVVARPDSWVGHFRDTKLIPFFKKMVSFALGAFKWVRGNEKMRCQSAMETLAEPPSQIQLPR